MKSTNVKGINSAGRNKVWGPFFHFYTRFRIPYIYYIGSIVLGILNAELIIRIAGYTVRVNKGELFNSVIIGYVILHLINSFVGAFQALLSTYGARIVTMRAQEVLWKKIIHLPQKAVDGEKPAQLISCVTNDVGQASTALTSVFSAVSSIYAFTRAVIALVTYNASIAAYVLLAIPIAIFVFFAVGRLNYVAQLKQYGALNQMTAWFSEHLSAAKYVKARALEDREIITGYGVIEKRFWADVFYVLTSELGVVLNSMYTRLVTVIIAVGGSKLIEQHKMEEKGINASSTYMDKVNQYLAELLTSYQNIKGTQGSLQRTNHILSLETEELNKGYEAPSDIDSIRFENVVFGYGGGDYQILKGVSFSIPAGMKTAIVGENGSGKSTVLKILQGFYAPNEGEIFIGDEPAAGMRLDSMRSLFSYVLQNTPLFSGTIKENIKYGVRGEVEDEDIFAAAEAADIHEFICSLPDGYDTQIGEGGCKLSGGQRQRVAIARALILKPKFLIFDEATASLDYECAKKVFGRVSEESDTMIYISHNMAEVCKADYIIVLKDGETEACGTPSELWYTSLTYRTLCEKQNIREAVSRT